MSKLLSLAWLILYISMGKAQQKIPVNITLFSEATAIPFTKLAASPIHPGIQIGSQINYSLKKQIGLYQTINIGYVFHNRLFRGIYVNTELGLDYRLQMGINVKGALGLGYMRSFSTSPVYYFNNQGYHRGADKGNGRLIASLASGLGIRLNKNELHSSEIFMMYQGWLEYPYSPGFIPVMTHINLQLGTKFYIPKNK